MLKRLYIPTSTPLELRPRALVVGASTGIGAELSRQLVDEGYVVALLARRLDKLEILCNEINGKYGEIRACAYFHDVTDYDSVPTLFQTIYQDLRGIDLVIYNAGIMHNVGFSEYNFKKDKDMIDVNLLGGIAWLSEAAKLFEIAGYGQIVGISSVSGDRGRVKNPGYSASKAGLSTYLESLRNRLTRSGVNVITIKSGPVATDMTTGEEAFLIPVDQAVADILNAIKKHKQIRYTPRRWWLIMLVIVLIPSFIFRRLNF